MEVIVNFVSKSTYPGREQNWDITFTEVGKRKGVTQIFTPEELQEAYLNPEDLKRGDIIEVEAIEDNNGELLGIKKFLRIVERS